ncbi:uncharacterized protein N7498_006251 [Penicillium cinerascens]|uniref:Uncharacterized protein n=1 Tax=Penicillium cinerascens TaxID=70096 RepID=A0A9W9SX21_9EURO|nr:uncharacterized protein N7498_006251 [Penicillium cinerascens]KAJ5201588.1 hypothetical protein N7498_006251 [Penicillium cinerascens]
MAVLVGEFVYLFDEIKAGREMRCPRADGDELRRTERDWPRYSNSLGTGQLVPMELSYTSPLDGPEAHGARRLGRDEHASRPSVATRMSRSGPRLFPLRSLGACAPNSQSATIKKPGPGTE